LYQNLYVIIVLIAKNVIKKAKKIIYFIVIDANSVMAERKICISIAIIVTNAI